MKLVYSLLACGVMLWSSSAQAAVALQYTRLVMAAPQDQIALRVWNPEDEPVLVQAWFDKGDADAPPESINVPFMVSQPLLRLDGGANRDILIRRIGAQGLPPDRESVVWLNVLDVPPRGESENHLQATIRQRIKLFWRPEGLPGKAESAATGVEWRWLQERDGAVLEARNPSAFHVSVVRLGIGTEEVELSPSSGLLRPFDALRVQLPAGLKPMPGQGIRMVWVSDAGKEQETPLAVSP